MTGYISTKKVPPNNAMQHSAAEGTHGESKGIEGC